MNVLLTKTNVEKFWENILHFTGYVKNWRSDFPNTLMENEFIFL